MIQLFLFTPSHTIFKSDFNSLLPIKPPSLKNSLILNIIEEIIPEYGMADENALTSIASYMKGHMKEFFKKMSAMSTEEIVNARYERFRKY